MTRWEPRSVLGFVIDAHWPAHEQLEALAACWAASEGDDALISGGDLPSSVRYVGLWQIPWSVAATSATMRELLDPVRSTQVAHSLWTERGDYSWMQSRTPLAYRKAWQVAKVAAAAGRGDTLLGSGALHPAANPPGSSATFGPGGLQARHSEAIATLNASRIG